jgi:hypothetical protein
MRARPSPMKKSRRDSRENGLNKDRIFIVTVIHGKRDIEKERGRIEKA